MTYGKVEEPSSSRSRSPSTARYAATSAILTVTSSKSDRALTSRTVNVVRLTLGRDGCGFKRLRNSAQSQPIGASLLERTTQHRSAAVSREAEFAEVDLHDTGYG